MIVALLLNKIKSFILIFVNVFRRALCCFRRRRRSSCESVPLTHVVSNGDDTTVPQTWEDWGDGLEDRKEKTVQDHIETYRKQTQLLRQSKDEEEPEEQLNFFEDMTPNITKQTKVLINTEHQGGSSRHSNRLNFVEDTISAVPTLELREWEETSGWEGDSLESDAQKVLREKKRQERERRVWEQQQKRQEKMNKSLGSKLST